MGSAGPDGSGGPHVFVDDLESPVLDPTDRHHLERVLRVRRGEPLTVSDGRGRWRPCRLADEIEPTDDVATVPEPAPRLTVAFALVKGERPEWVVQKLTELGVDVIIPFVAARSVVRWDARRVASNFERLTKVAREASMQSRRVWLPTVEPMRTFDQVAALDGAVLAQRGGGVLPTGATTVLVGPEGGWSDVELASDLPQASLAVHVLRAETAAIVAGTLLATHRAGLA